MTRSAEELMIRLEGESLGASCRAIMKSSVKAWKAIFGKGDRTYAIGFSHGPHSYLDSENVVYAAKKDGNFTFVRPFEAGIIAADSGVLITSIAHRWCDMLTNKYASEFGCSTKDVRMDIVRINHYSPKRDKALVDMFNSK